MARRRSVRRLRRGLRGRDGRLAGSAVAVVVVLAVIAGHAHAPAGAGTHAPASVSAIGSGGRSAGGGTLGCAQLEALWRSAGGSASAAFMAAEIAMAESSGREYATDDDSDGSVDRGYWQVNSTHGPLSTYSPVRQRPRGRADQRRRHQLDAVDHLPDRRLRRPVLAAGRLEPGQEGHPVDDHHLVPAAPRRRAAQEEPVKITDTPLIPALILAVTAAVLILTGPGRARRRLGASLLTGTAAGAALTALVDRVRHAQLAAVPRGARVDAADSLLAGFAVTALTVTVLAFAVLTIAGRRRAAARDLAAQRRPARERAEVIPARGRRAARTGR
jgi:hypothetical protein